MYLAQSTIEARKSARSPNHGCPYIKVICEELEDKWKTYSLRDIFELFVAKRLQAYKDDMPNVPQTWILTPEFSLLGNATIEMKMKLYDLLISAAARYKQKKY